MYISETEFEATYRPLLNPYNPAEDGPFNGAMLETYGKELDHVLAVHKAEPGRVWTIVEAGDRQVVSSGYHLVNRQGYIITEVPFEGATLDVLEDDDVRLLSDTDLCRIFEVCCYQNKDLPFPCADEVLERFTICTEPEAFPEVPDGQPDFGTLAEAEAYAVQLFALKDRYILRQLEDRLPLSIADLESCIATGELVQDVVFALELMGADYDDVADAFASEDRDALRALLIEAKAEYLLQNK